MGSFFSQHFHELFDEDIIHGPDRRPRLMDGSPSSMSRTTPNGTPKPRVLECDPRSPTEGITRTPIEVLSVPKGHYTTYESQHSSLPHEHTPCTVDGPTHTFSWMDPRSPALGLGFTRTPIRFLDVSDSNEEINNEDLEQVSHVSLADESAEEDHRDSSHTEEDIEQVLDVALVVESSECHDVNHTAEDTDQVSYVTLTAKSTDDEQSDRSETAEIVDQESHVALTESTGKDHVQVSSPKEERVHQENSQPIDVACKSFAGKNTSEVMTPIRHTIKSDCMSTSRVDDLKKGVVNTCVYSLDTPNSTDKAKRFIVGKENSSSVKKQVFYTPEKKAEDGAKPKVRTPLGAVCGNNSPMKMLRDKQSSVVKKSLSSRPSSFPHFNRTTIDRP